MYITFEDDQVIIAIPKAVLVLTRAQFIEALRRGKAYRRQETRQSSVAPIDRHQSIERCPRQRT